MESYDNGLYDDDRSYEELMMRCAQNEMEVSLLKGRLSAVESENSQLKQHIEKLAIENSEMIPKKRKLSKEVVERWEFYHSHKESVAKDKGLSDWREVKRACDELFLRQSGAH